MSLAPIISLERERTRRQPHECGTVTCARCGHQGIHAVPVHDVRPEIDCPVCHSPESARFESIGPIEARA